MSKLDPVQELLTNDLRNFLAPYFKEMEAVPPEASPDSPSPPLMTRYQVPSLDMFESWKIAGIVGGRRPSTYAESPRLWNPYFRKTGIYGVFFAFDLPREKHFTEFLKLLLDLPGFLELTVTDPYKHRALEALDELKVPMKISPQAEHTGAVNHIILDRPDGKILALNTDGVGMIHAIKKKRAISDAPVLIIGAGGSAASIGYEIVRAGGDLFIINRTPERAESLAKLLSSYKNPSQKVQWGELDRLTGLLSRADIIINTVTEGCPLGVRELKELKGNVLLVETKYGGKSDLRNLAQAGGLSYIDGQAMLFGQFVEAVSHIHPLLGISSEDHEKAMQSLSKEE
jgi:shikimate 5-dehydrogenase